MKRLLIPLLAALALPTAVNAEVAKYYLIGMAERQPYVVPTASMEACEIAGEKVNKAKNWNPRIGTSFGPSYICVKAK